MTAVQAPSQRASEAGREERTPPAVVRCVPVVIATALALTYVIVSPPSGDLPAHLFRAQLFSADPFGIWNNYWYAGHHTVGYSLLFPAVSAALTPQIAAALAAVGTAALFEPLVRSRFGASAWVGACVFAAATASSLFAGRLAFAFGGLPALASVLALDRRRPRLAAGLAFLSALASPVAALFAALAAAGHGVGSYLTARRVRAAAPGMAVAAAALAPVAMTAIAFPEGGTEPFAFSAFWPIPLIAGGALLALPRDAVKLRSAVILYALVTTASYVVATPLGSNAARLGTLLAAPLAVLLLYPRRIAWLLLAVVPLLYLEWQAPIRDLAAASQAPSASTGYYQPLLRFLERQSGPPFKVEIPFTRFHWEAYAVGSRFEIARGWERQLDVKYNALFYSAGLTPDAFHAWLRRNAVRFVATADAPLDYSGKAEARLIASGLPYLRLVWRTSHWRVYEVRDPVPIAQGAATLRKIGPGSLTFEAARAGTTLVRVHFTPYWKLAGQSGCVAPAGDFTSVTVRHPGPVRLVIGFSLERVGARSPRCT